MPGEDLAPVDRVVAEVAVGDVAVLVAEQPVALHLLRVELDLGLGVAPGHHERAGETGGEHPLGLGGRVDVDVPAVATVGELLEQVVVVVCDAHAHRDEARPGARLGADPVEDLTGPVAPTLATPSLTRMTRDILPSLSIDRARS